jgi:serine protease DegQ
MRRYWLLFAQAVTVALAVYFVMAAFNPDFGGRSPTLSRETGIVLKEAPAPAASPAPVGSFRASAEKASGAVVSISTRRAPEQHPYAHLPWFRFYFGDPGTAPQQMGLGSGVIVSPDGTILTNNHVIEGATEIDVQLSDSRQARATVIGSDPETDLAVLKISLERLPAITLGDSDALEVGDQVLAIGNPFGVGQTVTGGIVSALGRSELGINTFENFIQTDAAINPGNSGGALVDVHGSLMGINTAIYSPSGGSLGIGFAIPTSTSKQVLEGIVKEGVVTRGWIGVQPMELRPEMAQTLGIKADSGVLIAGVQQHGPADRAGIRPGDLVRQVAEKEVHNVPALLTAVAALKPGVPARLGIVRRNEALEVAVTPGRRPPARSRLR